MTSKKSRKPATRSRQTTRAPRQAAGAGRRESAYGPNGTDAAAPFEALTPLEHYRREKERRAAERGGPASDPLEEARREYRAMLAADAAKQKGGRPKKSAARPAASADADGDADADAADAAEDLPEGDEGDGET